MKIYHLTAYNTDEYEFFVLHYTNAEERDEHLRLEIFDAIYRHDLEIPSDLMVVELRMPFFWVFVERYTFFACCEPYCCSCCH